MITLKDKVIFITGSSKGIGRQAAFTFAAAGAKLAINGRNEQSLYDSQQEIEREFGTEVLPLPYDVRDIAKVKEAFMAIKKKFGQLDALVNNAGILQDRLLGMIDGQQMQQTLDTNLSSAIYHMQYAARLMSPKKYGSIVNLASIIGRNGNAGQVVYSASKAGLIGATMSAAKELAVHNIRVNAVAPGFIDTDMAKSLPAEKFKERLESIKMGRIGQPEDVANVICFLCSDLSSYVTGQVIGVDGGMLI
ncbi:SDR family NAD(P)-dependent oxidoreductase [Paenibacillus sp. NFR01]|uniref:SDR family NAD(P)-dependent oxidoreductase n=1 Tax=Paenibacillus sp. NFR01 TaxID=1566279 RepID=UPI0008AD3CBB|nr:SDR family NAD(P)-dependent oxidoreductase [Paenibacillus sp. NFR01]SEU10045.1 3-oxoacyl-[acyl-carrier protein] reductase [Paenibacillus sp. NFR01]